MKRILTITLVALVLVVIVSLVAVRFYLRSHRVTQQVTARLEAATGGSVRVGEVNVGLSSTTITGFELFEQESKGNDAPLLKVAAVDVDVSLWDLVSGAAQPKSVTFHKPAVLLRFNQAGELLTRFPMPAGPHSTTTTPIDAFTEAVIGGGEIIFRKEGQADLVFKNVNARLDNQAGRLVLSGSAENAEVGKLLLGGALEKDARVATVHLKSAARIPITQNLLDRLPFLPAEVSGVLQIVSGDTSADLAASYDMGTSALHYRIELVPQNVALIMPALELNAHHARARVVIEDSRAQLRDAQCQAFGGTIFTEADVDFGGPISKLAFSKIKVENLDANDLPEAWSIPAVVRKSIAQGKLYGNARLEMTIGSARISPAAAVAFLGARAAPCQWFSGAGVLATLPTREFAAKSQGKGQVRDPAGKSEPIDFDWQLAPRRAGVRKSAANSTQAPMQIEQVLAAILTNQTTLLLQAPIEKLNGPPDYFDVNFHLKNVSLADVVKAQGVNLPFPIDGKLSFQVKASIPIDRVADLKAYKAEGSMRITQLVMSGAKIEEVNADFHYADGTLFLTSLKVAVGAEEADKDNGGTMQGSGQMQIRPLGDLRLDLTLDRVPVHPLLDLPADKLEGTFSGKVSLRGQTNKLQSIQALEADGVLRSDRLKIYGLLLDPVLASVRLKDGIVKLDDLKVRVEGTPVNASAELRLSDDYAFLAELDLRDWSLASLKKLALAGPTNLPDLGGALTSTMVLKGKLNPFEFQASGDAKANDLKVDALKAEAVAFHWETDGARLQITQLDARLYDGKTTGSGVLPLDPKAAGKFDLRIHDLNVKQLARDLRMPFAVAGKVEGAIAGTLPPVEAGKTRTASLHIDLKAPLLRVQNIPTEQLHGTLEYQKGALDYKLEGRTLGGTFDLEGQIPPAAKSKDAKNEPAKKGRLSIQNVQVAGLFKALNLSSAAGLKGRLNLEVRYTHDTSDRFPEGQGTLRIANLRWNDTRLAENLQGDVVLSEQQLRVRDFGGDIAQGTLVARLTYYLRRPEQSSFTLNLDRVNARTLLSPWLDDKVEGLLQARLRGSLGGTWRGSADFEMPRGKVFGLEVAEWRLPVVWDFAPSQNRGHIEIHETSAQVTRGRATAKMTLAWEQSIRLEGQLRLERVELQEVLRKTMGSSGFGAGPTSARFDFAGKDVRSLNDIGGVLVASFQQAQALQVPVLQQIAPYLGVGPSTTFQKGDLRARLDRGALRVQQLTLEGNKARLYVDGSVALDGRLNLNVIAKSGPSGVPTVRLGPLALRVPIAGPVPLVLLQEASALLSNHVAHLQVTGTVRSPVIRSQPLALLSDEAVRFFLDRSNLPVTFNP